MSREDCFYFIDGDRVEGVHERITGEVHNGLRGYASGLWGNVTGLLSIGPIGSRRDITIAAKTPDGITVKCGCFLGTFAEWEEKCREVHGESAHGKAYAAAADFIRAYAEAYWQ